MTGAGSFLALGMGSEVAVLVVFAVVYKRRGWS
jgi:hypothetical protein